MEEAGTPAAKAGWYPDPSGVGATRYWDGSAWTDRITGKHDSEVPALQTVPADESLPQRMALFAKRGWRVESQTDTTAVMVKGKKPNHILHLLLTILTAGLWGIVWIILALTQKEHRMVLTADENGLVSGGAV